jgi:hypothetical protein
LVYDKCPIELISAMETLNVPILVEVLSQGGFSVKVDLENFKWVWETSLGLYTRKGKLFIVDQEQSDDV